MTPIPTRYAGSQDAARQSSIGWCSWFRFSVRVTIRITYPIRIEMPSFQSVSHVVHRMIRPEIAKATGDNSHAAGSRNGRSWSGSRLRNALKDSGAPAYMSTEALVIRPTSDCHDGKGRKQMHPVMKAAISPIHGTARSLVHSKIDGT